MINVWKTVVTERYAQFDGRAGQGEYWWFFLTNVIIAVGLFILGTVASVIFLLLYIIFALAMIVPGLGVAVRRLHDSDKSGWMIFVSVIPFVGSIILLVFLVMAGTPGDNKYGPPPAAIN